MSVYRRGDVWWCEFQHEGVRHRRSTGKTRKSDARIEERRIRDRVAMGEDDAGRRFTVTDAAASWWSLRGETLKSAPTLAIRLEICRRHLDFTRPICALTTADIAEAMMRRRHEATHNARPPTPSTINRDIIDTLRPVFTHARKVMGLPVQVIEWGDLRLAEPKGRVREFTGAEVARIMDALPGHHRMVCAFLARYGVRLSEAWFPLSAFDRDSGRIVLRQRKRGADHTITLLDEDRRLLASEATRAERAGLDQVWLWTDARGQVRPVARSSFQSVMRKAYAKLGIENARPAHDWRHHAATQFVRATGNLRAAQRLLGHENIATTARYAHASEADVTAGLEAVSQSTPHKNPHTGKKRSAKASKI